MEEKIEMSVMETNTEEIRIPRPPNAFMIFGKEHRRLLSDKFPQYTNKQISKILGEEWKNMSADRKLHYHSLADETHKQHLIKYPGYYYSPLEARQKKAERKRKSKMTRKSRKSGQNGAVCGQQVQSGIGSQSMSVQSPYPMMRPMFMPYMAGMRSPAIRLPSAHSTIRVYGPEHPFGGFVPQFKVRHMEATQRVMVVNADHNYSLYSAPQGQPKRNLSHTLCTSICKSHIISTPGLPNTSQMCSPFEANGNDLSMIMTNYLPPMDNPLIHITPVIDNSVESSHNRSNAKPMPVKTEVVGMVKADIDDISLDMIDDSGDDKRVKVIVKSVPTCDGSEPMIGLHSDDN